MVFGIKSLCCAKPFCCSNLWGSLMLRIAVGFFIFGILAVLLGANNIAGLSIELGKTILYVFLVLSVLSFLVSVVTGRRSKH
jgi:uncharacterized membrane protein YtjA (UPF0391 family)